MELSTDFINRPIEEVDDAITAALRRVGELAGVDRSYVFRRSKDGETISNTHEWCAPGIEPTIDQLQDLPLRAFPYVMKHLERGEMIHIPRVADLPPEASAEKEEFERENIKSLMSVPMMLGGRIVGFAGFDSVRAEKSWPSNTFALVKTVGEIFANALERRDSERRLREREMQLLHAQKMEAIGQLAAGLAHDLNNVVQVVQSYVEIWRQRQPERSEFTRQLGEISHATESATNLLSRMLAFGRRDSAVSSTVVDPAKTLTELRPLLLALLGGRMNLRIEVPPDIGKVRCDATLLETSVMNLATNARDAMNDGGELRIVAENSGPNVRISVFDEGPGVAPELAERIFEPFFTTKSSGHGTGLGLATTRAMVRKYGGDVSVESEKGCGAVFHVDLPLVDG